MVNYIPRLKRSKTKKVLQWRSYFFLFMASHNISRNFIRYFFRLYVIYALFLNLKRTSSLYVDYSI